MRTRNPSPAAVGRPAVKRQQIVRHLHEQIIGGKLRPQSRLPTRRELQSRFQTSLSTVQQALDQLADEGFIEPRGKAGTFVTSRPPHLARYGVVVPNHPHGHNYPRFWSALVNEASRLAEAAGRSVRVYHGLADREHGEDFHQFVHDVRRHCLAGVIYVSNPFYLQGAGVLENPDIPSVAIGGSSGVPRPIPAIHLDGQTFYDKAVSDLVRRGRRRIAIITVPDTPQMVFNRLAEAMNRHGLAPSSHLVQESPSQSPTAARRVAQLLMRLPRDERPDGLIIGDDNLVEYVSAGIVDEAVRVPDELDVVAHCNFPWPTPSVVAARRLGYDAAEVIAACLRAIDQQRGRNRNVQTQPIPARFEDELVRQELSTPI